MIDITWDGTYQEIGSKPPIDTTYTQVPKFRAFVELSPVNILVTQNRLITVTLTGASKPYRPAIFIMIKGIAYLDLLIDRDATVTIDSEHFDGDNNLVYEDHVTFTQHSLPKPSGIGVTVFNEFIVFSPDSYEPAPTETIPTYSSVQLSWGSGDCAFGICVDEYGKTWVSALTDNRQAAVARINTDGSLDNSFGTDGYLLFHFPNSYQESMFSIINQPDQDILVAGTINDSSNNSYPWGICRLTNSDGAPDTTFGTDGFAMLEWTASDNCTIFSILVQPNDKILVCGYGNTSSSVPTFSAARYMPNGRLDPTFGTNGTITITFPGNGNETCYCVALQPDNKILLYGGVDSGGNTNQPTLVRVNPDGSIDKKGFGTNGSVNESYSGAFLDSNSNFQPAGGLVLLPDGNIIIGFGTGTGNNGRPDTLVLAQYNSSGNIVTTFGTNGYAVLSGSALTIPYGLIIQSTGKIVALTMKYTSGWDIALARFNTDGTLDTSFGINGNGIAVIAPNPYGDYSGSFAGDFVVLPDDSLIICGGQSYYGGGDISGMSFVVHLTKDGYETPIVFVPYSILPNWGIGNEYVYGLTIDSSGQTWMASTNRNTAAAIGRLDSTGKPTCWFYPLPSGISDIFLVTCSIQSDQKIVSAGYAGNFWIVYRFLSDGTVDNTFGTNGYVLDTQGGGRAIVSVIQPDGKIIVGGNAKPAANMATSIMRYNTDGTIDTTFNATGFQFQASAYQESFTGIVLQPDNKIILSGVTSDSSQHFSSIALVRLNADGSIDNTFNKVVANKYNIGFINSSLPFGALALLSSGKILLGTGNNFNPAMNELSSVVVAQYNADGTPDNTFGTNGLAIIDTGPTGRVLSAVFGLIIQSTGKIVVLTKQFMAANRWNIVLLRFNPDGSQDMTFGTNGFYILSPDPYNSTNQSQLGGIVGRSDDSFVVGGCAVLQSSGVYLSFVIHFSPDGVPIAW